MDYATPRATPCSFDRFVFDANERVLTCDTVAVALPPKVIETLAILIEHAGHVVEKQMLRERLWPDGFVEDGNLTQNIYLLRRTLDPGGDGRRFIETVPRRGYRFAAPLQAHPSATPEAASTSPLVRATRAFAAAIFALALLAVGGASVGSAPARLSPAAARAYALGRFYWNQRTASAFARAELYFKETMRQAPDSALGYDGLADVHLIRAQMADGMKATKAELKLSERYLKVALRLDARSAEAHTTSAFIDYYFRNDHVSARREFALAFALNPSHVSAHQWYGLMLLSEGNVAAGTRELEVANAIDPTAEVVARWLGIAYYYGRRHDDALRLLRQSLDLVPGDADALFNLAYVQEQRGHFSEALAVLDRIAREHPRKGSSLEGMRAHLELAAHRRPLARALLRLSRLAAAKHIDALDYALLLNGLGRRDEAFQWLSKTRENSFDLAFMRLDPRVDPFRGDPRFARIFQSS